MRIFRSVFPATRAELCRVAEKMFLALTAAASSRHFTRDTLFRFRADGCKRRLSGERFIDTICSFLLHKSKHATLAGDRCLPEMPMGLRLEAEGL